MDKDPDSSIPGLVARYPNSNVQSLKKPLWCRLNALLGQGGDRIMMDLLLHSSIFIPVDEDLGNYYQLSGMPLSELKLDRISTDTPANPETNLGASKKPVNSISTDRSPGAIVFVRSRMLYAKAALNAKGGVRFGMRHIRWFPRPHQFGMATNVMSRRSQSISTTGG